MQYRGPVHATLDIPRPATVRPPIPNKAATPGVNADVAAVEAAKSTAAPPAMISFASTPRQLFGHELELLKSSPVSGSK